MRQEVLIEIPDTPATLDRDHLRSLWWTADQLITATKGIEKALVAYRRQLEQLKGQTQSAIENFDDDGVYCDRCQTELEDTSDYPRVPIDRAATSGNHASPPGTDEKEHDGEGN